MPPQKQPIKLVLP